MGGNAFVSFPSAVGGIGGWVELGRASVSAGVYDVSSLPDKRYYMLLGDFQLNSGGQAPLDMRVNAQTSNYAGRFSVNGASDGTATNAATIQFGNSNNPLSQDALMVGYFANLSSKEKLFTGHYVNTQAAGSGTGPKRIEQVAKWADTTNPIDQFQFSNFSGGVGAYDAGELVVLGWDPADVHTNNFWEELFSVQLSIDNQNFSTGPITAKKYLWLQFYQVGMTGNAAWRFNGDSTTSYARRHEINGNADAIVTSQTSLLNVLTGGTGDRQSFTNAFIINNSANDKLIIFQTVFGPTGAGTAPQKILGVCKWDEVAAQITSMTVDDSGAGFDTGSFLKIWGAN